MKIGLALSGGGYRAAAFHIGVMARLAKDKLLEDFEAISTVSGGSIAIALVLSGNNFKWPTSKGYIKDFLPYAYRALTKSDLQKSLIRDILFWPIRLLTSRAPLVSKRLQTHMGIRIKLNQIPRSPRWVINSTCFESGANFRFERSRMGDYKVGYVEKPDIPLSDAIAASSAFPVLIGPYALKTEDYDWYGFDDDGNKVDLKQSEQSKKLHLWDGGVYDNTALEALIRYGGPNKGYSYRSPIDYLIVSNASGKSDWQDYRPGLGAIVRLVSIPKYQVESLRSRDTLHRYVKHKAKGRYFDPDNYCEQVLRSAGSNETEIVEKCAGYLLEKDAYEAARIKTELKNLTHEQFILLFRQGFEVADCTLHAFDSANYEMLGYDQQEWPLSFSGER